MKKRILSTVVMVLLTASASISQIIYTDIVDGIPTGVDFNSDLIMEFNISDSPLGAIGTYITYSPFDDNNVHALGVGSWDIADCVDFGFTIDENSSWLGGGDCNLDDWGEPNSSVTENQDEYIAVRFNLDDEPEIYYGWIRFVLDDLGNYTYKDYAYNSTPDEPIDAGDMGDVLVTSISVQGEGGATSISTDNGTLQMEATVNSDDATDNSVTWSITAGTGATISATGLLTATDDGVVTVQAVANDGTGISSSINITISNQTSVILVSSVFVQGEGGANTISVNGGSLQIEAVVLPDNATDNSVSWSIASSGSVATIDASGLLTAAYVDEVVTVEAIANDGSGFSGTVNINISNQIPLVLASSISVQGVGGANTISNDGGTLQMEAIVLPDNVADNSVSWSIGSSGSVATIDASGLLTAAHVDELVTVVAIANDGSGISASVNINISNQIPLVLVSAISVQGQNGFTLIYLEGGTLQMEATVLPDTSSDNSVLWSVEGDAATINENGLLTAIEDGTVTVTATANDGTGIKGSIDITVSILPIDVDEFGRNITYFYPNPSSEFVYIETTDIATIQNAAIFSLNGKLISSIRITKPKERLDVSHLSSGTYLLVLTSIDGGTFIEKLMKR
jgi:uncharacterized protein YjdB